MLHLTDPAEYDVRCKSHTVIAERCEAEHRTRTSHSWTGHRRARADRQVSVHMSNGVSHHRHRHRIYVEYCCWLLLLCSTNCYTSFRGRGPRAVRLPSLQLVDGSSGSQRGMIGGAVILEFDNQAQPRVTRRRSLPIKQAKDKEDTLGICSLLCYPADFQLTSPTRHKQMEISSCSHSF